VNCPISTQDRDRCFLRLLCLEDIVEGAGEGVLGPAHLVLTPALKRPVMEVNCRDLICWTFGIDLKG
jgi:hypothetical protein